MITRRHFLQGTLGTAASITLLSDRLCAVDSTGGITLPELGRLNPLHFNGHSSIAFVDWV